MLNAVVWSWVTCHELDDGQLVRYHYSERDHEDEFGGYREFDPNISLVAATEEKHPGKKVVATVLKFWIQKDSYRTYDNATETKVHTSWKEDIHVLRSPQLKHHTRESLVTHFTKFNGKTTDEEP